MAPQKNSILRRVLKLNFRTNSFSAVKMNLFELNSSRVKIIFQLETRKLRIMNGNHLTKQEKTTHYSMHTMSRTRSFYFKKYPNLTTLTALRGSHFRLSAVHPNLIFSAKNGPKGKP